MREIPDAFDLRLLPDETLDGRAMWVIDATPKAGYKPKVKSAFFFPKVKMRFWIDRRDYQAVQAEIEIPALAVPVCHHLFRTKIRSHNLGRRPRQQATGVLGRAPLSHHRGIPLAASQLLRRARGPAMRNAVRNNWSPGLPALLSPPLQWLGA